MRPSRDTIVHRLGVVVAAVVLLIASGAAAESDPQVSRIVVVGEVQGAHDSLVKVLRAADVVDDQLHWAGGTAVLVQTGDFLDDGVKVREVMDLLMRLQDEAAAAGGRVIVLLGNHEAMNILGLRDSVNYLTYETFATDESEPRQEAAFRAQLASLHTRAYATAAGPVEVEDEYRSDWLAMHPPGYVEYVEAMAPSGRYGSWLRTLPVAVQLDGTLFIHGGISPALKGVSVDDINRTVAEEIAAFDSYRAAMLEDGLIPATASAKDMKRALQAEIEHLNAVAPQKRDRKRLERAHALQDFQQWGSWSLARPDGPMWFDGASEWDESGPGAEMAGLLDAIGVTMMVTGQSAGRSPKIEARFGGRVLLTSIGMSDDPWVTSEPACLEIADGSLTVISARGRRPLPLGGEQAE